MLQAGVNDPSSCALFTIVDDDLLEGDHELTFTIFGFTPMTEIDIGSPRAHVFTIVDNEGIPLVLCTLPYCIPITLNYCYHRFSCNCNARRSSFLCHYHWPPSRRAGH